MTEEIEMSGERHVFRRIIGLAVFVGLLFVAARFLAQKRDEFAGLTESEARAKFVDKVGPKMGDDTANEIADQVIPKLRERGLLKADPDGADADDDAADEGDKTSDAVTEAVEAVVDD